MLGASTAKVTVVPRMTHSVKLIDDSLGWCDAGMEVSFSKLTHRVPTRRGKPGQITVQSSKNPRIL